MTEQGTVTSFQQQRLREIRAAAPELQTGWLVEEVNDAIINEAHVLGFAQICPRAAILTPDMVRRLHAEGFTVRVWGVMNEEQMRQVINVGADGMTVNFPDKLIAYLNDHRLTV
jgi:glycerophosphoryl diester phosphodiesterase